MALCVLNYQSAGALPVRLIPLSARLQCAASRAAAGRYSHGAAMTAKIIQIRDYRRKEEKPLEQQAAEILNQVAPKDGSDGMKFEAPPEDCA